MHPWPRFRHLMHLVAGLLALALLNACAATTPPPAPTATPAARPSAAPSLNPPSPTTLPPTPPPAPPADKPNPFANLNADQKACLQAQWGAEAFQAITTMQRPPSQEEAAAFATCGLPLPGKGPEDQNPTEGPRGHQIMTATSPDGLHWTPSTETIREAGSVPEVVRLPDGTMIIYFVDGYSPDLGALRGTPETGWEEITLTFTGATDTIVDPDAVLLPDGRVRLFYLGENFPPTPNRPHTIYSATSEDGVHFTQDEGVRISAEMVTDPSVVLLPDGRWLMALSRGSTTLLAASNDGNAFQLTGVEVTLGGVPELALLPDDTLRLFVSTRDGIRSLHSTDGGQTWTIEQGVRIPPAPCNVAADPSVVQLPNGLWFMVWKQWIPSLVPDCTHQGP